MQEIEYPYQARGPRFIGEAIKLARKQKGLKQKELAQITGTSVKFISEVEGGKETVQLDKIFDLLRALSLQVYLTNTPIRGKDEKPFDFLG